MRALLVFITLVALGPSCLHAQAAAQQAPTYHSRDGKLPPLVVTRDEVEKLLTSVVAVASALEPLDTIVTGRLQISVMAGTVDGHIIGSDAPFPQVLDTLRRYLGATSNLTRVSVTYNDSQGYGTRVGAASRPLGNRSRVGHLMLNLLPSANIAGTTFSGNVFSVSGYDQELVDRIADQFVAFGKAHATWRTPRIGEQIALIVRVLALLLVPAAFALRERRGAWLLYPASAALLIATALFPFSTYFTNLTIIGG